MRPHGGAVTTILVLLLGIGVAAFLAWFFYCPCDRTPGGYLLGEEARAPVTDWSFVNDVTTVPLCQIQVSTGFLPHSVNLNCMADDGELFLSCASCDGKRWSTAAIAHPAARLRAGGTVYPVTVTRVTDPETLDRAWIARAAKLGRATDTPRDAGWWSFRVVSR
ncbi:MAG: hypothetical protein PVH91_08560 [Pseudomonadales bacterium]|jgi:hypothetical protein